MLPNVENFLQNIENLQNFKNLLNQQNASKLQHMHYSINNSNVFVNPQMNLNSIIENILKTNLKLININKSYHEYFNTIINSRNNFLTKNQDSYNNKLFSNENIHFEDRKESSVDNELKLLSMKKLSRLSMRITRCPHKDARHYAKVSDIFLYF